MKFIGGFPFPESPAECDVWRPKITYRPLARTVLVVARTRIEGKWAAYCDSVPGMDHDEELDPVLDRGVKLPEAVARAIFKRFAELPYAK